MPWTENMDIELKSLCAMRLSSVRIAKKMGLSKSSVINRARRLGIRFHRSPSNNLLYTSGHRAADARSAELLRQAGVHL